MAAETDVDYLDYYDSERFLFEKVGPAFRETGKIKPEEFFLILIWKANRAKIKHRDRITDKGNRSFSDAVALICRDVASAATPAAKLQTLMEQWRFRLPTATAILAVFYPDDFTVYDYRVCEQLKQLGCAEDFEKLQHLSASSVWLRYESFIRAVKGYVPSPASLRDKDRLLWGKSLYEEIQSDIGSSA